jgi:hypothetical protein
MGSRISFALEQGKLLTKVLEYNITEHCNLRCVNCDHASPLMPQQSITLEKFSADITALQEVLHTEELKIIGGEPLLNPRIVQMIECARGIGISDTITVATNGLLLHRMLPEFWMQIDRLWLSIYPGVKIVMPLEDIRNKAHALGFRLDVFHMDEFRHTILVTPIEDASVVRAIFRACELPGINYCHTLRNGYYYKCSPAPFAKDRISRLGTSYSDTQQDGVAIHDNPRLLDELVAYLSADDPLPACNYCLGSSGKWFPHRQLTQHKVIQALHAPKEDLKHLLDWGKLSSSSALTERE